MHLLAVWFDGKIAKVDGQDKFKFWLRKKRKYKWLECVLEFFYHQERVGVLAMVDARGEVWRTLMTTVEVEVGPTGADAIIHRGGAQPHTGARQVG